MKKTLWNAVKILLSAATFPLWFVKMFTDVGHFPDRETGEIVKVVFRYSMYENICVGFSPVLAFAAFAAAGIAIVLNAVALKSRKAKLEIIANVAFGVTIGLFIVLLLCASSVSRGY